MYQKHLKTKILIYSENFFPYSEKAIQVIYDIQLILKLQPLNIFDEKITFAIPKQLNF